MGAGITVGDTSPTYHPWDGPNQNSEIDGTESFSRADRFDAIGGIRHDGQATNEESGDWG